MRKIITTTIALLAIVFNMHAQDRERGGQANSTLIISTFNTANYTVMVDGAIYNISQRNDELVLNNLRGGNHNVSIYKKQRTRRFGNQNGELAFSKTIFLKPNFTTDILINRFGKVFVDESYGYVYQPGNGNSDYPYNNLPTGYPQGNYPHNGQWNGNGQNPYDDPYSQYGLQPMNVQDFAALKNSMSKENFSDNQLNIARQAISRSSVSVAQLKELMDFFSFDDKRLELAKFAYDYTSDVRNYYQLSESFSFSSTKESFNTFLSTKR